MKKAWNTDCRDNPWGCPAPCGCPLYNGDFGQARGPRTAPSARALRSPVWGARPVAGGKMGRRATGSVRPHGPHGMCRALSTLRHAQHLTVKVLAWGAPGEERHSFLTRQRLPAAGYRDIPTGRAFEMSAPPPQDERCGFRLTLSSGEARNRTDGRRCGAFSHPSMKAGADLPGRVRGLA